MTVFNLEDPTVWETVRRLNAQARAFTSASDPQEIADWVQASYVSSARDDVFRAAVEQTMRRNGATKRHWLAVDGPANMGKSEMAIQFALAFDAAERARLSNRESSYAHVPIIYVQADPKLQGAGLLRSICDFAGIPPVGNEDKMRRTLMQLLPRLDTRALLIDDCHMYAGSSSGSGRANSFRASIRLPVTFVIIGAGLQNSALLHTEGTDGYESAHQLRSRHTWLSVDPLTLPRDLNAYRELVGDFLKQLRTVAPHLKTPFQSDNNCLMTLFQQTSGHVGAIMGALKDATIDAVHADGIVRSDRVLAFAGSRLDLSR